MKTEDERGQLPPEYQQVLSDIRDMFCPPQSEPVEDAHQFSTHRRIMLLYERFKEAVSIVEQYCNRQVWTLPQGIEDGDIHAREVDGTKEYLKSIEYYCKNASARKRAIIMDEMNRVIDDANTLTGTYKERKIGRMKSDPRTSPKKLTEETQRRQQEGDEQSSYPDTTCEENETTTPVFEEKKERRSEPEPQHISQTTQSSSEEDEPELLLPGMIAVRLRNYYVIHKEIAPCPTCRCPLWYAPVGKKYICANCFPHREWDPKYRRMLKKLYPTEQDTP